MKKAALILATYALLLTVGHGSHAQELVTLTTPVVTSSTATNIRLETIAIDLPAQSVIISWRVRDAGGNTLNTVTTNASYPTPAPPGHLSQPTGATLIHTINTTNFSVTSLSKRIFQQLQADGYLAAGSIGGSAE